MTAARPTSARSPPAAARSSRISADERAFCVLPNGRWCLFRARRHLPGFPCPQPAPGARTAACCASRKACSTGFAEVLGERGVAAAVPPHVDDEPAGVAVLDETEQPVTERRKRLRRMVADGIEPEVDQVLGRQVLEPERQLTVAQVQR